MSTNLPAKLDPDRALISEVAMDIGKETVDQESYSQRYHGCSGDH